MKTLSDETKLTLESMVDSTSVSTLIETLSEICWEKAQHIRDNWQDEPLAQVWERAGNQLSGFYAKFSDRYHI